MTVDRPRDLEPCPERPEHYFPLHSHDRTHTRAHINTIILWAAGNLSPWATGIDAFWHMGLSSVNYTVAILAHSISKMNEQTFMPGNNSGLGKCTVCNLGPFYLDSALFNFDIMSIIILLGVLFTI